MSSTFAIFERGNLQKAAKNLGHLIFETPATTQAFSKIVDPTQETAEIRQFCLL
jgi:hypothetical protein